MGQAALLPRATRPASTSSARAICTARSSRSSIACERGLVRKASTRLSKGGIHATGKTPVPFIEEYRGLQSGSLFGWRRLWTLHTRMTAGNSVLPQPADSECGTLRGREQVAPAARRLATAAGSARRCRPIAPIACRGCTDASPGCARKDRPGAVPAQIRAAPAILPAPAAGCCSFDPQS